jgi:hypothetical protein
MLGLRSTRRSRKLKGWVLRLTRVSNMKEDKFPSTIGRDDSAGSITWLQSLRCSA